MKKIILYLVTIFTMVTLNAQDVTISDMVEQSKCKTFSCFNNFAISKDYSLKEIDTICCDGLLFKFYNDKYHEIIDTDILYKIQCNYLLISDNKGVEINIATRDKFKYLAFAKELDSLNFKSFKETTVADMEGGITTHYSYPDSNITLAVTVLPEKDLKGNKVMVYFFALKRFF